MRDLLQRYFNIAFLMGKPQDLPGGSDQMKVGVALALLTYLMALVVPYGITRALLQAILDLGCTALVLHMALNFMGHPQRFNQAFGGLCGASAFINLAAVPLYSLRPVEAGSAVMLSDYLLLVWGLSLLGHVIRHTFELNMVISIAISLAYFVLLSTLIGMLMPFQTADASSVSQVTDSVSIFISHLVQSGVFV